LGTQHGTDGVTAKANQVGQQMAAGPLEGLRTGASLGARADEGF